MAHELTVRERIVQGNCTAEEAESFIAALEDDRASLQMTVSAREQPAVDALREKVEGLEGDNAELDSHIHGAWMVSMFARDDEESLTRAGKVVLMAGTIQELRAENAELKTNTPTCPNCGGPPDPPLYCRECSAGEPG